MRREDAVDQGWRTIEPLVRGYRSKTPYGQQVWGELEQGVRIAIGHAYDAGLVTTELLALIADLAAGDPWLPGFSLSLGGKDWCYFCNGEDRQHDTACPWVKARGVLGK